MILGPSSCSSWGAYLSGCFPQYFQYFLIAVALDQFADGCSIISTGSTRPFVYPRLTIHFAAASLLPAPGEAQRACHDRRGHSEVDVLSGRTFLIDRPQRRVIVEDLQIPLAGVRDVLANWASPLCVTSPEDIAVGKPSRADLLCRFVYHQDRFGRTFPTNGQRSTRTGAGR